MLRACAAPHVGRLRAPCKPRHVAARKQPRHDGCSRTGKYHGIVEHEPSAQTRVGAAQVNMNAHSSWPICKKLRGGKCRLEAFSRSSERNRLRCGQEKIRHNSRSARPCRHLFRFSLDLHYAIPLGAVFMAFLGEKLFAFLFLNRGCAPAFVSYAAHGRQSKFEPLSPNLRRSHRRFHQPIGCGAREVPKPLIDVDTQEPFAH